MTKRLKITPARAAEIARALIRIVGNQIPAADLLGISQGTLTEYLAERSGMGESTYKAAMRLISDYEERATFLNRWLDHQFRGRDHGKTFDLVSEDRHGPGGGHPADLENRSVTRHPKHLIPGIAVDIATATLGMGMLVNGDAVIFYRPHDSSGGTSYEILYPDREDLKPMTGTWASDPLLGHHK